MLKGHKTTLRKIALAGARRYPYVLSDEGWATATDGHCILRVPHQGPTGLLDPKTFEAIGENCGDFPDVTQVWSWVATAAGGQDVTITAKTLKSLVRGSLRQLEEGEAQPFVDFPLSPVHGFRVRFMDPAKAVDRSEHLFRTRGRAMNIRLGGPLLARCLQVCVTDRPVTLRFFGGLQPVRLRQFSAAGHLAVEAIIMPMRRD